ncbi:sodium:solute symporter family transporter [Vibrio crassostreae]|uniref:sodium:solute symporter family transporter n=1 Tax=Vibrio crassostreae TaxID=246167 RepID=UPI0040693D01
MELIDSVIVGGYFAFVLFAALAFKRFTTDSSGFIRGGGAMMWWMAGATAFMTQFSAWTFTGAAAKAYEDGLTVLFIFWGNAVGFFVAASYFAVRYRKMRVETAMEAIKVRFGRTSEQVYTWLSFPLTIMSAAIWLNGLALFAAAVFNIELVVTIVGVGLLVTFIAASGGSWTVSATNVIQLILLVAITMSIGGFALLDVGGVVPLIDSYPTDSYMGADISYWQVFWLWVVMMLLKQTISANNALSCYRFLVTTNEREARKAALFAGFLFIFGPVMWFIPPWVTAAMGVDLVAYYPKLAESANNAAYVYYIDHFLPVGMLGLVLAAMLAATIAPMTTALNRNAGIFVRNVYQSVFNPSATEHKQLSVGKVATVVNGLLCILAALLFASIKEYSFFDIMMLFGALLQTPLAIPSLLALVTLRTPDWSGWATICVGLAVSFFMQFVFNVDWLLPWFDADRFTSRESVDLLVSMTLLAHILITGGFFISTQLFYRESSDERGSEITQLKANLETPISPFEEAKVDTRQGAYLGRMCQILGVLVALISITTDSMPDASVFVLIGLVILLAGTYFCRYGNVKATSPDPITD